MRFNLTQPIQFGNALLRRTRIAHGAIATHRFKAMQRW
jgi:hypothetical protein